MKKAFLALSAALVLSLGAVPGHAATDIRERPVNIAAGRSAAVLKGRIVGREIVDYLVKARAGQTLKLDFRSGNGAAYFNLLPPASETALFVGSTSGHHYEGVIRADGTYRVRVYLMRSAARRHEAARYTLKLALSGEPVPIGWRSQSGLDPAKAFNHRLEFGNVRFRLVCANSGSLNTLRVTPSGTSVDNTPLVLRVEGSVVGAQVADLDANGAPELYIYVQSAGSGSYGSVLVYAAARDKAPAEIPLPALAPDSAAAQGYRGHDEFALSGRSLLRRFPVYREGDVEARPGGGMRQLQYRFEPGEAGATMRLERVLDY